MVDRNSTRRLDQDSRLKGWIIQMDVLNLHDRLVLRTEELGAKLEDGNECCEDPKCPGPEVVVGASLRGMR